MHVLVRINSATSTPVDCGEGAAAAAKIAELKGVHGADNVVNVDGSAIVATPVEKKGKASKKGKSARKGKK